MAGVKPGENVDIADGNAKNVDVTVCWPFHGQPLPTGTRVDLTCHRCGCRVCADPNSQRFVEGGSKVICALCAAATGLVKA